MPNRLAAETSPYLQQHAENPVDWYPWGEEAFAQARRTGKPILLSIGYSACHWCHVMAHESFEDPAIAAVMNELFVNIKVDREERPDVDQVYQVAQAMLTQRNGGWPLTMFLTPSQLPFFGGTYFPATAKYGMPAFPDLLRRVRGYYDGHRDEAEEGGKQVAEALQGTLPQAEGVPAFTRTPVDEAAQALAREYDPEHGGFGAAPKFPHPDAIELLLRCHARTGDAHALEMAAHTLRCMANGGIHDHVGGGFARYSTDAAWTIPHFEKMLYDNGWLLRCYAEAWTATKDPRFEEVCAGTAGWAMREMQSPEGGYYSSLDADSEGEEGRYYVWTPEEVRALLAPDEFRVASLLFGLDRPPNFEGRAWHLARVRSLEETARGAGVSEGDIARLLDGARRKLRAAREARVRPGRDEKILASWNALMIGGMARAARAFGRLEWLASARRALDFLRATLWKEGRLLATYKDGRAHLEGYLDDHAFLLAALLEVLQAEFRIEDLDWARRVGETLLERFHDADGGGFHFTAHDHEALILRPKPGPDQATPSGNGVAAWALQRLGHLTGDMRFVKAAEGTLALFWPQVSRQPRAFGSLLATVEEHLDPPRIVVVRGARDALSPWRHHLGAAFLPGTVALVVPAGEPGLPEALDKPGAEAVNAWVCEGVTCLPPIGSLSQLQEILRSPKMAG